MNQSSYIKKLDEILNQLYFFTKTNKCITTKTNKKEIFSLVKNMSNTITFCTVKNFYKNFYKKKYGLCRWHI